MTGQLVPIVVVPRFTSFTGVDQYFTLPVRVDDYSGVIVDMYRGPLGGTGGPTFRFHFYESTDRDTWDVVDGSSGGIDPGDKTEFQETLTLKKKWFRVGVALAGTDPMVTCWMTGFLIKRER